MALWQDKGLHLGGSPPPRRAHQPSLPVECVVGPDRELVLVKGGKKLTVEQVERSTVRLRSNLSFRPSFSEIVDLSEVEEVDLKADEFLKLADQIDPFSTTAKRAFPARTSVRNHAARMPEMLRPPSNVEIFSTLNQAERWILT